MTETEINDRDRVVLVPFQEGSTLVLGDQERFLEESHLRGDLCYLGEG